MKMFNIPKGTHGLLLTEQAGIDIEQQEWETLIKMEFKPEDVAVDPMIYKNHTGVYTAGSLAEKLAKNGYIIFNRKPKDHIKQMLAVQYSDVIVS